jgi:hypothetical protein
MRTIDRRVRRVEHLQTEDVTVAAIVASPAWADLRRTIVTALRPYPEATRALADALRAEMDRHAIP